MFLDQKIAEVYTNGFKSWEFGKEAAQIFASGTSAHCWIARREWRWEFCKKADAVKNQFFRHVVY